MSLFRARVGNKLTANVIFCKIKGVKGEINMGKWENVKAIGIIAVFYLFLELVLGVTCPILYFTGISCAGCGMSRAWMCLLHLDFAGAFYYHPLFWLPAVGGVLLPFWNRISKKVKTVLLTVACILLLGVYIWRMLDANDKVVVFQPENGVFAKLFFRLIQK